MMVKEKNKNLRAINLAILNRIFMITKRKKTYNSICNTLSSFVLANKEISNIKKDRQDEQATKTQK